MGTKLTVWFDKNDTAEKQYNDLKRIIATKIEFNVVSVKYSKKIGKIFKMYAPERIKDFSFENLERGIEILDYTGEKRIIDWIPISAPLHIKTKDGVFLDIGEFELYIDNNDS